MLLDVRIVEQPEKEDTSPLSDLLEQILLALIGIIDFGYETI